MSSLVLNLKLAAGAASLWVPVYVVYFVGVARIKDRICRRIKAVGGRFKARRKTERPAPR